MKLKAADTVPIASLTLCSLSCCVRVTINHQKLNDKPDVDEGDEVADAPDRRKVNMGTRGETFSSPKASADNQPQTLDFEQRFMMQRRSSCRNKSTEATFKSRQTVENSTEDEQNEFAEALR